MKKKFFILLFIVFIGTGNVLAESDRSLTLKEAIEISLLEAKKWNEKAMLYFGLSVDSDKKQTGMDGKRKHWNFQFGIPYKTDLYLVTIRNGKVKDTIHIPNELHEMPKKHFFHNMSDFVFDSPELLKKGRKTTKIYPGETFAKGYNFGFRKDAEENIPLAMVIGWDEKKSMIYLLFNVRTGELVKKVEREQYLN